MIWTGYTSPSTVAEDMKEHQRAVNLCERYAEVKVNIR